MKIMFSHIILYMKFTQFIKEFRSAHPDLNMSFKECMQSDDIKGAYKDIIGSGLAKKPAKIAEPKKVQEILGKEAAVGEWKKPPEERGIKGGTKAKRGKDCPPCPPCDRRRCVGDKGKRGGQQEKEYKIKGKDNIQIVINNKPDEPQQAPQAPGVLPMQRPPVVDLTQPKVEPKSEPKSEPNTVVPPSEKPIFTSTPTKTLFNLEPSTPYQPTNEAKVTDEQWQKDDEEMRRLGPQGPYNYVDVEEHVVPGIRAVDKGFQGTYDGLAALGRFTERTGRLATTDIPDSYRGAVDAANRIGEHINTWQAISAVRNIPLGDEDVNESKGGDDDDDNLGPGGDNGVAEAKEALSMGGEDLQRRIADFEEKKRDFAKKVLEIGEKPESEANHKELDELAAKHEELERKYTALKSQTTDIEEVAEHQEKTIEREREDFGRAVSELQGQIAETHGFLLQAEGEIQDKNELIDQLQKALRQNTSPQDRTQLKEELKKSKIELKQYIKDYRDANEANQSLSRQLSALHDSYGFMMQDFDKSRAAEEAAAKKASNLGLDVINLNSRILSLNAEREKAEAMNATLRANVDNLEFQLANNPNPDPLFHLELRRKIGEGLETIRELELTIQHRAAEAQLTEKMMRKEVDRMTHQRDIAQTQMEIERRAGIDEQKRKDRLKKKERRDMETFEYPGGEEEVKTAINPQRRERKPPIVINRDTTVKQQAEIINKKTEGTNPLIRQKKEVKKPPQKPVLPSAEANTAAQAARDMMVMPTSKRKEASEVGGDRGRMRHRLGRDEEEEVAVVSPEKKSSRADDEKSDTAENKYARLKKSDVVEEVKVKQKRRTKEERRAALDDRHRDLAARVNAVLYQMAPPTKGGRGPTFPEDSMKKANVLYRKFLSQGIPRELLNEAIRMERPGVSFKGNSIIGRGVLRS